LKSAAANPKQKQHLGNALDRLAAELTPIRTEGLTENLVRKLKDIVLRGVVKPGERLPPERDLAALLNVSRSSLRQALKALQVMGVLEVRQGSGNYLTRSADHILREPANLLVPLRGISFGELYEARRAIEAQAAACAASRASADDISNMRRELDRMRSVTNDLTAFVRSDAELHHHIAVASGNNVFIWFQEMVNRVLWEGQLHHIRNVSLDNILSDHERIVEAIGRGDAAGAREAMLTHLILSKAYPERRAEMEIRVTSPALPASSA
jgi:GntR family transcriptional regulator, transcriptional repressor for pyruvate dehydrogenase complex